MESFQLLHSFWIDASWRLNFLVLPWSLIIIQLLTALKTNNSFQTNNIKYNPGNDFLSFSSFSFLTGWLAYEWTQMKQNEVDKRETVSTIPQHTNLYFYYCRCFIFFLFWICFKSWHVWNEGEKIWLFIQQKSVHEQRGE